MRLNCNQMTYYRAFWVHQKSTFRSSFRSKCCRRESLLYWIPFNSYYMTMLSKVILTIAFPGIVVVKCAFFELFTLRHNNQTHNYTKLPITYSNK